jgi:hypothetical protein
MSGKAMLVAQAMLGMATLPAFIGCAGEQPATDEVASSPELADGFGVFPVYLRATVVATGIPGAGAITPVGHFLPGSPIHDKPALAALAVPGMVLDPQRLLVASTSNFGAPLARPSDAPGTVLSIDVDHGMVTVPADFATAGGQAATSDGLVQVYAAQNAAFLNSVNNPAAVTAAQVSASLPLGISLNRGNGRPWVANAPTGATGEGTITVLDPNGLPLAGAPDPVAGGVFAGDETNRNAASTKGLDTGAIGTAIMTKSPDGTGKAVFLAAEADGSVVQVHVLKGVDALAPAGTITPITDVSVDAANSTDASRVARAGLAFNWVPTRIAYVADPKADRVVALDLTDDGTLFIAGAPRVLSSRWMHTPVDVAPTSPEVSNGNFASNTTLGGGSDLYVLNRGDNSIVRVAQTGKVIAVARMFGVFCGFRANGIAVSEDGQTIWVTAVIANGGGIVLRVPAFGAGFITPGMVAHARAAGATDINTMGADMFATDLTPLQAVGPLFNGRACGDCHKDPIQGGMGAGPETFVTRVGAITNGTFDPLIGRGGPVARAHSISEFGFRCNLPTGVPPTANVTSLRSAMTLRGTALIDFVQVPDILKAQAAEPDAVRGKLNALDDGRIGRFGWKAQFATLVEFMGDAFTHEMGITNPLAPNDEEQGCGASFLKPEIDGVPIQGVTAFMNTINPPVPSASCLAGAGATTFATIGCASCHNPSFPGPGRTINLYSDLLVHDMGPALNDQFVAGSAQGNEWRTAPLWRLADRVHFMHDGRAVTIDAAVAAHGGQAAAAAAAFAALDAATHQALLDFLGCI